MSKNIVKIKLENFLKEANLSIKVYNEQTKAELFNFIIVIKIFLMRISTNVIFCIREKKTKIKRIFILIAENISNDLCSSKS